MAAVLTLAHPLSGEVLPDDERAQRLAVAEADERIGILYRQIDAVREARNLVLAELPPPAVPPRLRDRTQKQHNLERCPRCGTPLGLEESA